MKHFFLHSVVCYCVSFYGYITKYIFINIFQVEHFSVVKFDMGYEKNKSFFVISKS